MRMLGLLGGMSWESTVPYYRLINQRVQARLGGLHSARLLLWNADFQELEALMRAGDWDGVGAALAAACSVLEQAGAEGLVLCTNTLHRVAPAIEAGLGIPLLHLIDVAGDALVAAGHRRVGLLGTAFTMEQPFYRERLAQGRDLQVLVPDVQARAEVHRIIFEELCQGRLEADSRGRLGAIMANLEDQGAEAILLACTELSLLVRPEDSRVPQLDTTELHARHAADWMLAG